MNRIFIGNISSRTTKKDLYKIFERYGEVLNCDLKEKFAFIDLDSEKACREAIRSSHRINLLGKDLIVEMSHSSNGRNSGGPRRSFRDGYRDSRNFNNRRPNHYNSHRQNYRIKLSNLSSRTSWQDLKDFARENVGDSVVRSDVWSNRGEHFGVVEFSARGDYDYALHKLSGKILDEKEIEVSEFTRHDDSNRMNADDHPKPGINGRSPTRRYQRRYDTRTRSPRNSRRRRYISRSASRDNRRDDRRNDYRRDDRRRTRDRRDDRRRDRDDRSGSRDGDRRRVRRSNSTDNNDRHSRSSSRSAGGRSRSRSFPSEAENKSDDKSRSRSLTKSASRSKSLSVDGAKNETKTDKNNVVNEADKQDDKTTLSKEVDKRKRDEHCETKKDSEIKNETEDSYQNGVDGEGVKKVKKDIENDGEIDGEKDGEKEVKRVNGEESKD